MIKKILRLFSKQNKSDHNLVFDASIKTNKESTYNFPSSLESIQENIKTLPSLNLSNSIDSNSSSSEIDTFLNELMESLVKQESIISGEFYNDILYVALDNKISISKYLILRKNIPN